MSHVTRASRAAAASRRGGANNAATPSLSPPPRLSIPEEPPKVPRRPPSKGNKRETLADIAIRIPINVMRTYFNYPLRTAAEAMNISVTTLKRLCRRHGVKRWPHRQISGINRAVSHLQAQHEDANQTAVGAVADQLRELHRRREIMIALAFESDDESTSGRNFALGSSWASKNSRNHGGSSGTETSSSSGSPSDSVPVSPAARVVPGSPESASSETPFAANDEVHDGNSASSWWLRDQKTNKVGGANGRNRSGKGDGSGKKGGRSLRSSANSIDGEGTRSGSGRANGSESKQGTTKTGRKRSAATAAVGNNPSRQTPPCPSISASGISSRSAPVASRVAKDESVLSKGPCSTDASTPFSGRIASVGVGTRPQHSAPMGFTGHEHQYPGMLIRHPADSLEQVDDLSTSTLGDLLFGPDDAAGGVSFDSDCRSAGHMGFNERELASAVGAGIYGSSSFGQQQSWPYGQSYSAGDFGQDHLLGAPSPMIYGGGPNHWA